MTPCVPSFSSMIASARQVGHAASSKERMGYAWRLAGSTCAGSEAPKLTGASLLMELMDAMELGASVGSDAGLASSSAHSTPRTLYM